MDTNVNAHTRAHSANGSHAICPRWDVTINMTFEKSPVVVFRDRSVVRFAR